LALNPFMANPWGMGLGLAAGLGSMWAGSGMPRGDSVAREAFNQNMQQGYGMANSMVPGMANNYYSQMMGGPMGRALRLNSMQSGLQAQQGMRGALAGSGLMRSGVGAKMQGLAGGLGFNMLSQGQAQMGQNAWGMANQNFNNMFGGAMGNANQLGMAADQRRYGMMGAGFGGLGQMATGWKG
jgi:hypothetical protein